MNALKKCCFNCRKCVIISDGELGCKKYLKIIKTMNIGEADSQFCDEYDEEDSDPDPFE